MTKKDYQILAVAIGQAYAECETEGEKKGCEKVLEHIGHVLQTDNPRFQPGTFMKAVRNAIHR